MKGGADWDSCGWQKTGTCGEVLAEQTWATQVAPMKLRANNGEEAMNDRVLAVDPVCATAQTSPLTSVRRGGGPGGGQRTERVGTALQSGSGSPPSSASSP